MKFALPLLLGLAIFSTASATIDRKVRVPPNPCPEVFQYYKKPKSGVIFGRVEVPFSGARKMELGITASLVGAGYSKKILIIEKAASNAFFGRTGKALYNIFFPFINVIPRITKITYNGEVYCEGKEERLTRLGTSSIYGGHLSHYKVIVAGGGQDGNEDGGGTEDGRAGEGGQEPPDYNSNESSDEIPGEGYNERGEVSKNPVCVGDQGIDPGGSIDDVAEKDPLENFKHHPTDKPNPTSEFPGPLPTSPGDFISEPPSGGDGGYPNDPSIPTWPNFPPPVPTNCYPGMPGCPIRHEVSENGSLSLNDDDCPPGTPGCRPYPHPCQPGMPDCDPNDVICPPGTPGCPPYPHPCQPGMQDCVSDKTDCPSGTTDCFSHLALPGGRWPYPGDKNPSNQELSDIPPSIPTVCHPGRPGCSVEITINHTMNISDDNKQTSCPPDMPNCSLYPQCLPGTPGCYPNPSDCAPDTPGCPPDLSVIKCHPGEPGCPPPAIKYPDDSPSPWPISPGWPGHKPGDNPYDSVCPPGNPDCLPYPTFCPPGMPGCPQQYPKCSPGEPGCPKYPSDSPDEFPGWTEKNPGDVHDGIVCPPGTDCYIYPYDCVPGTPGCFLPPPKCVPGMPGCYPDPSDCPPGTPGCDTPPNGCLPGMPDCTPSDEVNPTSAILDLFPTPPGGKWSYPGDKNPSNQELSDIPPSIPTVCHPGMPGCSVEITINHTMNISDDNKQTSCPPDMPNCSLYPQCLPGTPGCYPNPSDCPPDTPGCPPDLSVIKCHPGEPGCPPPAIKNPDDLLPPWPISPGWPGHKPGDNPYDSVCPPGNPDCLPYPTFCPPGMTGCPPQYPKCSPGEPGCPPPDIKYPSDSPDEFPGWTEKNPGDVHDGIVCPPGTDCYIYPYDCVSGTPGCLLPPPKCVPGMPGCYPDPSDCPPGTPGCDTPPNGCLPGMPDCTPSDEVNPTSAILDLFPTPPGGKWSYPGDKNSSIQDVSDIPPSIPTVCHPGMPGCSVEIPIDETINISDENNQTSCPPDMPNCLYPECLPGMPGCNPNPSDCPPDTPGCPPNLSVIKCPPGEPDCSPPDIKYPDHQLPSWVIYPGWPGHNPGDNPNDLFCPPGDPDCPPKSTFCPPGMPGCPPQYPKCPPGEPGCSPPDINPYDPPEHKFPGWTEKNPGDVPNGIGCPPGTPGCPPQSITCHPGEPGCSHPDTEYPVVVIEGHNKSVWYPGSPILPRPPQIIIPYGPDAVCGLYNQYRRKRQDSLEYYPWVAAIMVATDTCYKYKCTATLVSNGHVLTTARCLMDSNGQIIRPDNVVIVIGTANLDKWVTNGAIIRGGSNIQIGSGYNPEVVEEDIAVITMDRVIETSDTITPICLFDPNVNHALKTDGLVVGWGISTTTIPNVGDFYRNTLSTAPLAIFRKNECRVASARGSTQIGDTAMCAGDRNQEAPCIGDSGAPFMVIENGKYFVRGIVSKSKVNRHGECARDKVILSDVGKMSSWILNAMNYG